MDGPSSSIDEDVLIDSDEIYVGVNTDPWDGHYSCDEELIKERTFVSAYQSVIHQPELIEGKTVLDLSSGCGLFSLLCARAGAAHVYSVDVPPIIHTFQKIVDENGFSTQITCIPAKYITIQKKYVNLYFIQNFFFLFYNF